MIKVKPNIMICKPVFDCVKSLEDYIETLDPKKIVPCIVGSWEGRKEVIRITGKKKCTSSYLGDHWAVRWKSGTGKGLFGSGLAFYGEQKEFPNLPEVK